MATSRARATCAMLSRPNHRNGLVSPSTTQDIKRARISNIISRIIPLRHSWSRKNSHSFRIATCLQVAGKGASAPHQDVNQVSK